MKVRRRCWGFRLRCTKKGALCSWETQSPYPPYQPLQQTCCYWPHVIQPQHTAGSSSGGSRSFSYLFLIKGLFSESLGKGVRESERMWSRLWDSERIDNLTRTNKGYGIMWLQSQWGLFSQLQDSCNCTCTGGKMGFWSIVGCKNTLFFSYKCFPSMLWVSRLHRPSRRQFLRSLHFSGRVR